MVFVPDPDPGPRWKRNLGLGIVLLFVVGIFIADLHRPGDFRGYVICGEALLRGADIYDDTPTNINNWPPFFSFICVPLALLDRVSPSFARGIWMILNFSALLLILDMLARLTYDKPLRLRSQSDGLPLSSPSLLVPLALILPYLLYHFQYHQVNLIIFAVVLGGLMLQERDREWLGGALLGTAAALKVMPVLFVPYLLYRKRWFVSLSSLATTAALSLSPVLVLGWPRFLHNMETWLALCGRKPWGAGNVNQSLYALWDRLIGHGIVPFFDRGSFFMPFSGDPRARLAWLLSLAVASLLILFAFRGQPPAGSLSSHLEWSVIFLIASVFGPIGWKHYLVVLLLPYVLLYAAWHSPVFDPRIRRTLRTAVMVSFVPAVLTSRGLVGRAFSERLETGSVLTFAALVLFATLLWLRRRLSSPELSRI